MSRRRCSHASRQPFVRAAERWRAFLPDEMDFADDRHYDSLADRLVGRLEAVGRSETSRCLISALSLVRSGALYRSDAFQP